MNAQVGFKEVQAYAQTHNVDFKTAAKQLGLSEQDAKMLEESMNGGANWGKIMDEVTFSPEKADIYRAEAKAKQQEDVKNHPEKYEPKTHKRPSGNYIVYQKDPETGKDTFKFYAADGTQMKEADFKKQEKMENVVSFAYNPRTNSFETTKEAQTLRFTDENGKFDLAETGKSVGKILFGMTLGLFVSCGEDNGLTVEDYSKTEVNNKTDVKITISDENQKALIAAMKEGFDSLLAKINELGLSMKDYGDQIVALLVQNNSKLDGITKELQDNGKQNEEIIKMLTNINNTVSTLTEITSNISADVKLNGESVKTQLNAILNAINSNNLSISGLNEQMGKLQDLLKEVINNQETSLIFQENSNMNEKKILDAINNIKYADESKQLATIVDILKDIKGITQSIDNKLTEIQNTVTEIKNKFGDDGIAAALDKLMEMVQANNDKADVTNELLKRLLDYAQGGVSKSDIEAVINAINQNGSKIDETNQLLAKMQNQDEKFQQQILQAIGKLGTDISTDLTAILNAINSNPETGKGIEALLKEVLAQLDKMDTNNENNFKTTIDAIKNISVTGGTADLSAVEALLKELVDLNKQNGVKLDTLTQQNETIITILKSFQAGVEQKFNELNVKVDDSTGFLKDLNDKVAEILDKLANGTGGCKVDFDTLMAKLQEILEAINDHKVVVDVTGKVTCECNCGNKHEGIIGDLDSILG